MMNIGPMFTSFLASEQTKELLDPSVIATRCKNLRISQGGFVQSGGWQSGFIDPWSPVLQELTEIVWDRAQYITRNLIKISPQYEIRIDSVWANLNKGNTLDQLHNNPPHLHANQFISFVYYAEAHENCGKLTLSTPSSVQEYTMPRYMLEDGPNEFNCTRMYVYPEPGLLVAFPSYIMHNVDPNLSGRDRISIAYNIALPHQNNAAAGGRME
jgi:uncharacterized protein (TIGR02466 family)